MAKLTKRFIDTIKPTEGRDVFHWDDALKGFGVRIKPSGSAAYLVQYRTDEGVTRRLTIGKVRTLTPDEARELALAERTASVATAGLAASRESEVRRGFPALPLVPRWWRDGKNPILANHAATTRRYARRYCTLRTHKSAIPLILNEEQGVMSKSILEAKVLQDEAAAYAWVEARIWPEGPVCPHCGGIDRISKMGGKSTRIGVYKCYACRQQFSVKVGAVCEYSHVPMRLWLQAMFLMCSSKKGISSNQLHRTLGVTLKTAWFMSRRIREAMRIVGAAPMGNAGEIIEIDETFIGKQEGQKKGGPCRSNVALTLVTRGGEARTFHVDGVAPVIRAYVSKEAFVMTDELRTYQGLGKEFWMHQTVNHSQEEYVRGIVHTNTISISE